MRQKRKRLTAGFFNRPTLIVARDLLGKFMVRKRRGREITLMITEVEAYDGPSDQASHASRGKTARNTPMFGKPGHWYVYFTYGMHWLINIVTRETGYPAAVLIRGGVVGKNGKWIRINGPARIAKFLQVNGKFTGLVAASRTNFWIEDCGVKIPASKIKKGPRVGISYAGPYWAKRRWRFWIEPLSAPQKTTGLHMDEWVFCGRIPPQWASQQNLTIKGKYHGLARGAP